MDKSRIQGKPAYRIGLLLIDGLAIMSYSATTEPFRAANQLAGYELYKVINIPAYGSRATSSSGVEIKANAQVGEVSNFDLLLVIAGSDPSHFKDRRIFMWLRHLARQGMILGGVSGGPMILAAADVMQGRRMTVHWEHVSLLRELYPKLIIENSLYVMDRDRYTCAGGTAPLDMMHAIISHHQGADFARKVCDWFMHTKVRSHEEPQRSGLAERYHTKNPVILHTIEVMRSHLNDPLDLPQLSQINQISARQLNRLFKENMGLSTMAFYRDLRLDKARQFLEKSPLTVTEVALATGFSSSANFSKAFRAKYNWAPSAFRK